MVRTPNGSVTNRSSGGGSTSQSHPTGWTVQPGGTAPVEARAITVFVVDDHQLVRQGIVDVISQESDIVAAGNGGGDAETLRALTAASPRVLVVDLEMPSIRGPAFIAMARDALPELRVVVCTM